MLGFSSYAEIECLSASIISISAREDSSVIISAAKNFYEYGWTHFRTPSHRLYYRRRTKASTLGSQGRHSEQGSFMKNNTIVLKTGPSCMGVWYKDDPKGLPYTAVLVFCYHLSRSFLLSRTEPLRCPMIRLLGTIFVSEGR